MEIPLTFARHYARLVWLLLYDAESYEAQIASLSALVSASRAGPVTIQAREWRLAMNDEFVPDRYTGAQDLTAQLIGHSILEFTVVQGASPADMLLLARILASEPVPGDGGKNVLERLRALDARTVHIKVETLPAPRPAVEAPTTKMVGMIPDVSLFTAVPAQAAAASRTDDIEANGDHKEDVPMHEGELLRDQDPEHMFHVFSANSTPKGSMVKLFEQLDAARSSASASRTLDALLKLAASSARKERYDIVADVFHGIITREAKVEDRAIQRQFGVTIRRLAAPTLLKCVVDLLPRRNESYERYMTIFERTEDAGAEALVDALMEAPSLTDRRVYYDSLLRIGTGIRTLMHMLGDPRWYVVRNAVDLLGEMRASEAEGELVRLLEHKDDRVRTAAAGALAKLGARHTPASADGASGSAVHRAGVVSVATNGKSVNSLIRALDREDDTRVQMAMLAALGQLGTPQAIEKLVEIARTDKGLLMKKRATPLRVAAVHALGQVNASGSLAALQSLLRDKEKAVRGAASWVIMGRRRAGGS
ncbi:MAG TPA: HEAT repeat domain-containing protein [Gemmatimonadaceae bacterium]|nr:HEAT repeat domain-containing protein [Gemmatimonadaceae bacterium]